METPANVLITGGSRGIGFALARRYLAQGARVLETGRSAPDLERAAAAAPGLATPVSDLGAPADREALARLVSAAMPGLDLLVHNAGIQRRIALAADTSPWTDRASEIGINLAGPVHLSHLLIPVMLAHRRPATVVTVTSGGAFVPQPFAPLYSATKAALHRVAGDGLFAGVIRTRCRPGASVPRLPSSAVRAQVPGTLRACLPAGVRAAATRSPTSLSVVAAIRPARTRRWAADWSQQQRPSRNRSGSVPKQSSAPPAATARRIARSRPLRVFVLVMAVSGLRDRVGRSKKDFPSRLAMTLATDSGGVVRPNSRVVIPGTYDPHDTAAGAPARPPWVMPSRRPLRMIGADLPARRRRTPHAPLRRTRGTSG